MAHYKTKHVCNKCGEEKPFTPEYFVRSKGRSTHGLKHTCKKCHALVQAEYRKRNPSINKDWRKKNKKHLNEYMKKWRGVPKNHIAHMLRCRLRYYVVNKPKRTMEILGCDSNSFFKYIEDQFVSGMSWDNMSSWEIDHIKPCSEFDLTKDSDILECFHYTNLRPVFKLDNVKKGGVNHNKYRS